MILNELEYKDVSKLKDIDENRWKNVPFIMSLDEYINDNFFIDHDNIKQIF